MSLNSLNSVKLFRVNSNVSIAVIAFCISHFFDRVFFSKSFQVPGHSARPTLLHLGDAKENQRPAVLSVDPGVLYILHSTTHQVQLHLLPVQSLRDDVWSVLGVSLVLYHHCCLHTSSLRYV